MERSREIEVETVCINPECKKPFTAKITIIPVLYGQSQHSAPKKYVENCPWCKTPNLLKLAMDL
jgi:hypothetical protein